MRHAVGLVLYGAALVLLLTAAVAILDQGKPGTQGPWPVAVTSGGLPSDGGYLGVVTVIQGVGIDGGPSWNIAGQGTARAQNWTLVYDFNLGAWLDGGNTLTTTERIQFGYPSDGGAPTMEKLGLTATGSSLAFRMTDLPYSGVFVSAWLDGLNTTINCYTYIYGTVNGPNWDSTTFGDSSAGGVTTSRQWVNAVSSGGGFTHFYLLTGTATPNTRSYGTVVPSFAAYCTPSTGTLSSANGARFQLWGLP